MQARRIQPHRADGHFFTPELRGRTADLVRQYDFAAPVIYQGGTFHEAEAAERSLAQILATD